MTKSECLLCVGGPRDGAYVEIAQDRDDVLVITMAPTFIDFAGTAKDCSIIGARATATVSRVVYVRSYWQAEAGAKPVCVLVPNGQSPRQTLEHLLANYQPRVGG